MDLTCNYNRRFNKDKVKKVYIYALDTLYIMIKHHTKGNL